MLGGREKEERGVREHGEVHKVRLAHRLDQHIAWEAKVDHFGERGGLIRHVTHEEVSDERDPIFAKPARTSAS